MHARLPPLPLPYILRFAKKLRTNQTHTESILWKKLRARRFQSLKFRRQVPIGPYIVDFLCIEAMLVLEIDGSSHWQPGAQEHDAIRDDYLHGQGFRVLRISNHDVQCFLDDVMQRILRACFSPSPKPSPQGEG